MADVVVLPSMWDEPAGLTMVEAAFCGVPVLTTLSGGIPEYVYDYAVFVDRNADIVDNIASEIIRILSRPEKPDNSKIVERLDAKDYINRFLEALQ